LHASPPSSATVLYIHDLDDHIIAETDASGNTLREYVWLGDTPLAVVDNVPTSPAIFYVHTDHLMRPLRMTDASAALAWSAAYEPFGTVASVNAISSSIDLRFPGQWFQLESGLHYNRHRHYDASTGRYVQPDPLLGSALERPSSSDADVLRSNNNRRLFTTGIMAHIESVRASGASFGDSYSPRQILRPDGPSLYNYAVQNPLTRTDPTGLVTGAFTPHPPNGQISLVDKRMCKERITL
jgi:RHS repeat-associated protein